VLNWLRRWLRRASWCWPSPASISPGCGASAGPAVGGGGARTRPWRRFLLGWVSGIVYWFGVCHWIQFTLAVYGGMGDGAAWAVFTLLALIKGLHMRCLRCWPDS